jgi:hypothetical protein
MGVGRATRPAVIRMLVEEVAECPICGRPVRRNDPRDLTDTGLAHLVCTGRKIPPDPPPEGYEEANRREERKLAGLRGEVASRVRGRSDRSSAVPDG